jgi:hypothetical protein
MHVVNRECEQAFDAVCKVVDAHPELWESMRYRRERIEPCRICTLSKTSVKASTGHRPATQEGNMQTTNEGSTVTLELDKDERLERHGTRSCQS